MVVASGLRSMGHRELLSTGQGGTGAGPLSSPRLALHPPPFLRNAVEPSLLRPHASEIRRSTRRATGPLDDRASSRRNQRLARRRRDAPGGAGGSLSTRIGPAAILPGPQSAIAPLAHENPHREIEVDRDRHQPHQVMHHRPASLTAYAVSQPLLATRKSRKVALSN